jgi:hypothetical protein
MDKDVFETLILFSIEMPVCCSYIEARNFVATPPWGDQIRKSAPSQHQFLPNISAH